MKTCLSVLVILGCLTGCVPMMLAQSPTTTVESIKTGELVSKKMRDTCPDIVQSCRTTAMTEVQKSTAGQLPRFRGNQDSFDQLFMACVRDHEKDCDQKNQISEAAIAKPDTDTPSQKRRMSRRRR